MTKTFKFYTNNKKNNSNEIIFSSNYYTPKPDYSKVLDDIIAADVAKDNAYLFKSSPIVISGCSLKDGDAFTKAANFLANYKKIKKNYLPFTYGKMYTLSDGTPIVFEEDEIQIGFDVYKYSDFSSLAFLNKLTTNTKKLIINIYTNGITDIDINIL